MDTDANTLLAEVSTYKQRWTELRLFRGADGYLVVGAGRTLVPGESDRQWSFSARSAAELCQRLARKDANTGEEYLSPLTVSLLEEAARRDPAIAEALAEWE